MPTKIAILWRMGEKGHGQGRSRLHRAGHSQPKNAIVGHTVANVDKAVVLAVSAASSNKGRIGAVILKS